MARRMTKVSEQVLRLLKQHHLLSASQILTHLVPVFPTVNKTTVYRSLEFMAQTGLICQHQFGLKEAVFELRTHHHDHLVCTQCGRLQTVECLTSAPKEIDGFQIDHHHLTAYGLCPACQQAMQP